jgi:hypothetical protein
VGENHGTKHVVVAVKAVHAVQQRDGQSRLYRMLLVAVVEVGPGLERVAGLGVRVAAAEHRPEKVLLDIAIRLEERLVGLGHLPDFFIERHFRQQRIDLRIERRQLFRVSRRGTKQRHRATD